MTSLNEKNLSASPHILKNILHRPVNILFYMGLLVILVAALIPIFENIAGGNLVFILFFLGFGYWGYQHGHVDLAVDPSKQSPHNQSASPHWKVLIALLGLITLFGIYLTLAMALKYDFQAVFQYIVIRFILLLVAYTLGYYGSYRMSTR